MNMEFVRKLTIPAEVKEMYPPPGRWLAALNSGIFS